MRLKSALLSWFLLVSWTVNVWYDNLRKVDFILLKVTLTAEKKTSKYLMCLNVNPYLKVVNETGLSL